VEFVARQVDVADAERSQLASSKTGIKRGCPQRPLSYGQRLKVVERLARGQDPLASSP
jgi:hypothetical protein